MASKTPVTPRLHYYLRRIAGGKENLDKVNHQIDSVSEDITFTGPHGRVIAHKGPPIFPIGRQIQSFTYMPHYS